MTPLPGPTAKIRDMTFDRPMFQGQPDLIERPRILTKAVIGGPGHLQLLLEIGWESDLEPAWQCGLPRDEFPLPAMFAVFTALYERALDLDLGSQPMFPLIPCAIPKRMEGSWIQP